MPLTTTAMAPIHWARHGIVAVVLVALAGWAQGQEQGGSVNERLRQAHASLQSQLTGSALGQPLLITSSESQGELQGQVHAIVSIPFAELSAGLARPQTWCEILILHLNTKRCTAGDGSSGSADLSMAVTRKNDHEAKDAYLLDFRWSRVLASADALQIIMTAPEGPLGTANYRIVLEAIPLPAGKSFLSFSYACRFSGPARLAMRTYLATFGRDKVGFTKEDGPDGAYVGGMRGVIERTAMRYYLAIEAWAATSDAPEAQRRDLRLRHWFDATERYPRQLHEVDLASYLAGKRLATP
jgi:hypothetical protein